MFVFKHRNPEMQLAKGRTALVLADIQNEFLEEKEGTYYALIEEALKKRNVIPNLEELLKTAQKLEYFHHPFTALVLPDRPSMVRASERDCGLS
jgi:hypothetical protein